MPPPRASQRAEASTARNEATQQQQQREQPQPPQSTRNLGPHPRPLHERNLDASPTEMTNIVTRNVVVLEEFYSRPRLTVTAPPRVIAAPILDRKEWLSPLCVPCFCTRGNGIVGNDAHSMDIVTMMARGKTSPMASPEPQCSTVSGHFLWRFFCLRDKPDGVAGAAVLNGEWPLLVALLLPALQYRGADTYPLS
ncbi:hypothetical protein DQ04_02831030 [Trypanosoma grayi]|uniref:hypothetical protein n=1 Tax=Trypanosoma grayi TaxID=71804 RepID=UPI0004F4390E|nr:hypothetical protein DQ04_02831030 [Trypanosoma grayi]KEG11234.1 hypothetical protein DQ04_02831030 [Trypanosoma grayi]